MGDGAPGRNRTVRSKKKGKLFCSKGGAGGGERELRMPECPEIRGMVGQAINGLAVISTWA